MNTHWSVLFNQNAGNITHFCYTGVPHLNLPHIITIILCHFQLVFPFPSSFFAITYADLSFYNADLPLHILLKAPRTLAPLHWMTKVVDFLQLSLVPDHPVSSLCLTLVCYRSCVICKQQLTHPYNSPSQDTVDLPHAPRPSRLPLLPPLQ